jgi:hypothetical protein
LSSGSVESWFAGVGLIFTRASHKSTSFWGTIRLLTQPYSTSVPVCPHDRPVGVGAALWPRRGYTRRKPTLVSIRVGPGLLGQGRHSNISPRSPSQSRPLQGPASAATEGSRKRAQLHQGWRHCCGSAGALFGPGWAWPGPSAGHWARRRSQRGTRPGAAPCLPRMERRSRSAFKLLQHGPSGWSEWPLGGCDCAWPLLGHAPTTPGRHQKDRYCSEYSARL